MPRKLYTLVNMGARDACNRIHETEKVFRSGNAKNPYIEGVTNSSDAGRYREIHHVEGCSVIIYDYQPTTNESKTVCVIEVIGGPSRIPKARDRLAEITEAELVEQTRN